MNYYISTIFWSTTAKVLKAIISFFTIPLLLGYYGKSDYGILAIATACNGYMHILDLGMNVGAVKFYSQWKIENKFDKLFRVAQTNITFYSIIAVCNIIILLLIALYGESLFSITHTEFLQLKDCLFIISLFNFFNWITTVFNQLLIADKQLSFTMQVQCVQAILSGILVLMVIQFNLNLTTYFFYSTFIIALAFIPYLWKSLQNNLIKSIIPKWYWNDFKEVLIFSLSIFALSLFQMTAAQSRPIILSIFAENGTSAVTNFRIVEVIPSFIITLGGSFSGIFLPKTSEMVARNDENAMHSFAYKWTTYTTIFISILCFPFIICAKEALSAYVGNSYGELSIWLILWCITVLIQMHTTPSNALVLAKGKTKILVQITAAACTLSLILNAILCQYFEVGSAIIAYGIYTIIIIGLYYIYFYKKLLNLSRLKMLKCFFSPIIIAIILSYLITLIPIPISLYSYNDRISNILICIYKTTLWITPYVFLLHIFKVINLKDIKNAR